MVSFAKEQVIGVQRLSKRLGVSSDTIRRWFKQGLERRKVCGKVFTSLEALDRFAGVGGTIDEEAEMAESMASLKRMGVNVGKESRDGQSKRATAQG